MDNKRIYLRHAKQDMYVLKTRTTNCQRGQDKSVVGDTSLFCSHSDSRGQRATPSRLGRTKSNAQQFFLIVNDMINSVRVYFARGTHNLFAIRSQ